MSKGCMPIDAAGISAILPGKQLQAVDGVVTHNNQPVICHWCKWTPQPDDVKGADGLMLGGFTKVAWLAQLAKRKHYRLAVHSCQGRQANPLVVLTLSVEAEAPQRAAAEATVGVG